MCLAKSPFAILIKKSFNLSLSGTIPLKVPRIIPELERISLGCVLCKKSFAIAGLFSLDIDLKKNLSHPRSATGEKEMACSSGTTYSSFLPFVPLHVLQALSLIRVLLSKHNFGIYCSTLNRERGIISSLSRPLFSTSFLCLLQRY